VALRLHCGWKRLDVLMTPAAVHDQRHSERPRVFYMSLRTQGALVRPEQWQPIIMHVSMPGSARLCPAWRVRNVVA
jgi:hypothetical protein